jgi:peptidoglycan/LPS O-acetylase OafA/YrhL
MMVSRFFRPCDAVISYGLYIYHLPVWYLMGLEGSGHSLSKTMLGFVITLVVAALSWHLFESPINSLKRLFSYRVVPKKVLSEVPLQLNT